jgi:hypothetical protein
VRRQDAVVLEMVVIVGLGGGDDDALEPLDHAATDAAGDDDAHREAVVRQQRLAVLHVGEHDVPRRVQGPLARDAGAVLGSPAAGEVLGALEAHVEGAALAGHDAAAAEHVAEARTAPHGRGHAGGAPVEAHRLLHHVLLLAPVARARQRHGDLHGGEVARQLLHGEPRGPPHEARHLHGPRRPVPPRHGAVVAHVVQRRRGDEAVVHQPRQRRLAVERVLPRQPHQARVPLDPRVRGAFVARVLHRGLHLQLQVRAVQLSPVLLLLVLVVRRVVQPARRGDEGREAAAADRGVSAPREVACRRRVRLGAVRGHAHWRGARLQTPELPGLHSGHFREMGCRRTFWFLVMSQ